MSRPRNPNGVRRAHTRNGKPVRASSIPGRKAPKRRLNASARRRVQRKPMLYAAGTLAGLGALDAILTGRWGGAIVLGSLAGGFLLGHLVWSHHRTRQARKPAKPKPTRPATQQRREALEKARAAHQPAAAPPLQVSEASEARMKQRRYDEMQRMMARQRKRGQTEMVWPDQYEEFFDGPGQVKPRPDPAPSVWRRSKVSQQEMNRTTSSASDHEPKSHAESVAMRGHRCDCSDCRARRKAGVLR